MTNSLEEQLTAGMRERVAHVTIATDIVGETLRIQGRRTMIARAACAVGVIGLVGAITTGVLATGGTKPGTGPNRSPVAVAQSPELRLAAAVTASQSTSYKVKTTLNRTGRPPMIIEGAFDPATATGYLRETFDNGGWHEERLVDGDRYHGDSYADGKVVWGHILGKYTTLVWNPPSRLQVAVSADPQSQLDALTKTGAKISQTGPDTYHFEAPFRVFGTFDNNKMVGDVTVGADHRVAKVMYKITFAHSGSVDGTVLDVTVTMELSDYGAPVTVNRPDVPGK